MNGERLLERRKWFRVFPEGTLEFVVITRVLALMMLMALAIVGGTQRPLVLVSLIAILWIDYALLLWWVVQVAMDLRSVSDPAGAEDSAGSRARVWTVAALPSVAAAVALVPWYQLMTVLTGTRPEGNLTTLLPAVAGLAFLLLLWPACQALRRIDVGSPVWTILLLVPLLHFFALHRIGSGLDVRIRGQLQSRDARSEAQRGGTGAMMAADVTWVLSILPWVLIIGVVVVRGWPTSRAFKIGPVCGTILAAVFAIANLAAMESVQRRIVALLRKT